MERYRRWLRVPIAATLLVACGATALVACGDGGSAPLAVGTSTTQPGVTTTGSPAGSTTANQASTPSTGPGGGTPTTAGSGATGSTAAAGGGTTPPTTAAPTTSGSARSLSVSQLVAQRASLVGERVTVDGRALFLLSCPPGGSGCTASGYLADRGTESLPPSASAAQAEAMLMAQGSSAIGCGGVTSLTNLECGGFQHGGEYRVTGTVSRLSNVVVLDVGAKQRL